MSPERTGSAQKSRRAHKMPRLEIQLPDIILGLADYGRDTAAAFAAGCGVFAGISKTIANPSHQYRKSSRLISRVLRSLSLQSMTFTFSLANSTKVRMCGP